MGQSARATYEEEEDRIPAGGRAPGRIDGCVPGYAAHPGINCSSGMEDAVLHEGNQARDKGGSFSSFPPLPLTLGRPISLQVLQCIDAQVRPIGKQKS